MSFATMNIHKVAGINVVRENNNGTFWISIFVTDEDGSQVELCAILGTNKAVAITGDITPEPVKAAA